MVVDPEHLSRFIYSKEIGNSVNIFLCGKDVEDPTSIRKKIQDVLSASVRNNVVYPEWIFADILADGTEDLLSLEKYLADCVDLVILPLESVGTYAELGAFASNKDLARKTIVLNEEKFKRFRSFINLGPIAAIRKQKKENILYFTDANLPQVIAHIDNKVRNHSSVVDKNNFENAFNLSVYSFALIALFNPISFDDLLKMAKNLQSTVEVKHLSAALKILFKKQLVYSRHEEEKKIYYLSEAGKKKYYTDIVTKYQMSKLFYKARARVLSFKLRKLNKFSGGRARKILELGGP